MPNQNASVWKWLQRKLQKSSQNVLNRTCGTFGCKHWEDKPSGSIYLQLHSTWEMKQLVPMANQKQSLKLPNFLKSETLLCNHLGCIKSVLFPKRRHLLRMQADQRGTLSQVESPPTKKDTSARKIHFRLLKYFEVEHMEMARFPNCPNENSPQRKNWIPTRLLWFPKSYTTFRQCISPPAPGSEINLRSINFFNCRCLPLWRFWVQVSMCHGCSFWDPCRQKHYLLEGSLSSCVSPSTCISSVRKMDARLWLFFAWVIPATQHLSQDAISIASGSHL